jgi:phosphoribosylaminoimidazolecarboxamide formyltransferase/IMP cyclohydrolase
VPGNAGERIRLRRALLSVDSKDGLVPFAQGLHRHAVELWATRGTAAVLEQGAVPVQPAEQLTGIGAWFDGRLKTLHPGVLGGILAPRGEAGDQELTKRELRRFDLVIVNFYPFDRIAPEDPKAADRIDLIDIGGLTLARSAAKNHAAVTVASDPSDYPGILEELDAHEGTIGPTTRRQLAGATFARVAAYDTAIARAFASETGGAFPGQLAFTPGAGELRYGENPHQPARTYAAAGPGPLAPWPMQLQLGEALSYNNLLDLDASLSIVAEFPTPTAAVVKHGNPSGVASGTTIREALERALASDRVARYGCAIAVNRELDAPDLGALEGVFVDLLAAPSLTPATLERAKRRRKLKLVIASAPPSDAPRWEARTAAGHLLLQEVDRRQLAPEDFRSVTTAKASPHEACSLDFAWRIVRHAKSNAIVLASGPITVGIGSGQPTRVKAVELAVEAAGERAKGSVLASDAFFPFADGLAAKAGIKAIIQPGGSVRDAEVIETAEKAGIAMYMTGWRVFRH